MPLKIEVKAAMLILQDQLPKLGSGYRPVLYWVGEKYAYVFWMPDLRVYRVHPKLWEAIPRSERPDADLNARAAAIEINRSGARTRGAWDGGKKIDRLLELLSGQEVAEDAFDSEEVEDVAAKPIPPSEFPFQDKDRVTLTYDKEFKGTVRRAGPEVSTLTPDGEKSKELHIPNGKIEKLPPQKEEATNVGSATGKKKTTQTDVAKKTPRTKAATEKKASASPFAKVRIVITIDKNPRAEGSLAHTRFANMQRRVKAHPEWSAQQILDAGAEDKVPYRSIDLRADEERKSIKLLPL
jgi:hypothetical protein